MVLGSRQNGRTLDPVMVHFREDTVHESPCVKNLGVLFDKHFTWDSHVSSLTRKCYGILIGLAHVRHIIPRELLSSLSSWTP